VGMNVAAKAGVGALKPNLISSRGEKRKTSFLICQAQ
jgi:hypothetical protein